MEKAKIDAPSVNSNKDGKEVSRNGDRRRYHGKKSSRDFSERKSTSEVSFKPGNDFSWWVKNVPLIKDSTNFTPNWIPGTPLDETYFRFYPTGVIRCRFIPTYGSNYAATDPLNMQIRDLFLRMFQKYRGISSYQQSDLGMVLISEVEIIGLIAKLERIYGVINRYSGANFNMPETEISALGLTEAQAQYIRTHMSDYRYDLNYLINKAQRLMLPKDFSVIADRLSLLGFEYLDHDQSSKAQIIVFDTEYFGVLNETDLTTGTNIQIQNYAMSRVINFNPTDSETMFPLLEEMLNALLTSDSVQKILGDLLTWFGQDQMLVFEPLPENYVVIPTFSESILHKLHNVHLVQDCALKSVIDKKLAAADKTTLQAKAGYVIYQSDNVIWNLLSVNYFRHEDGDYGDLVGYPGLVYVNNVHELGQVPACLLDGGISVLDTYRHLMDPESVVEGVLWKVGHRSTITSGDDDSYNVVTLITSAAFEIFVDIALFARNANGGTTQTYNIEQFEFGEANAAAEAGHLAVCDWAPLTYAVNPGSDEVTMPRAFMLFGEYENMRVLNSGEIKRIQTACVISGVQTDISVINK